MAKLYFRYGTVGSAKTLNLLAVAHSYEQQKKRIILIKPELDDRFGKQRIASRCGLEKDAHFLADAYSNLHESIDWRGIDCVLVDEAQFLSFRIIDQLREIANEKNIPVICYGLRTDFKSKLFEGSQRLLELADQIEEVKMTCAFCQKKAVFNLKFVNEKAVADGPSIELGCEELYLPACPSCYELKIKNSSSHSTRNIQSKEISITASKLN